MVVVVSKLIIRLTEQADNKRIEGKANKFTELGFDCKS